MIKKILNVVVAIISLFYFNFEIIFAYEFVNSERESTVDSMINQIYMTKETFEELVGDSDEEDVNINPSNSDQYWWPVGSVETTTQNGKLFATGTPETVVVSSDFGVRTDPATGKQKVHRGTDITGGRNGETNIIASKSGVVVHPDSLEGNNIGDGIYSAGYGNYVIIQHLDGNYTLYGHLAANSILVKAGDQVEQGQVIAKMGSSGYSTGTHLHFEIRIGENSNSAAVKTVGTYIFPDNPRPAPANVVSGENDKQTICLTLKNGGYSDNGVVGIMRNMFSESSWIHNNLEGKYEKLYGYTDETYTAAVDNGTYKNFVYDQAGYGLVQWTYHTRKAALLDYKKSKNVSIGDIGMQLEFFVKEMESDFPSLNKSLKDTTSSAETLIVRFCKEYENPATSCQARTYATSEIDPSALASYVKNGCK